VCVYCACLSLQPRQPVGGGTGQLDCAVSTSIVNTLCRHTVTSPHRYVTTPSPHLTFTSPHRHVCIHVYMSDMHTSTCAVPGSVCATRARSTKRHTHTHIHTLPYTHSLTLTLCQLVQYLDPSAPPVPVPRSASDPLVEVLPTTVGCVVRDDVVSVWEAWTWRSAPVAARHERPARPRHSGVCGGVCLPAPYNRLSTPDPCLTPVRHHNTRLTHA